MSLLLVAIGAALALPSYRDMVEKRQVTNGAEQLASFINTAQGVAMKTNQVVWVSFSHTDSDQWCIGAGSGAVKCDCEVTDPDAYNFCKIASQPFILDNSHAGDRKLMHTMTDGTGDDSYAFDPVRGLFVDLNDFLTLELRSDSEDFRLNLLVNNTGRVILCSDSASHAVPGYPLCSLSVVTPDVEIDDPEV
jgi:type IV fimbrial biogenesis protein FimT